MIIPDIHTLRRSSLHLKLAQRNNYAPQEFEPYQPEAYHQDVHKSKARYNALIGSPGLGKTIFGCVETVRFFQSGPRANGLILMPTYSMLYDIAMKELRKWLPRRIDIPRSKQAATIEIGNGRAIFLRSAEHPKTIAGLDSIFFVWIDEADLMDKYVWDLVKERLRRQSGMATGEKRVVITGTPELNSNGASWVRDEIIEGHKENNPSYYHRVGTIWECTRYSQEEKDEIDRENPKGTWARSRIDGEYVLPKEGHVYRDMPTIGQPFKKWTLLESDEIVCGIDCGFDDPFVFGILGRKGSHWTVFYEYRNQDVLEEIMARDIALLIDKLELKNFFNFHHSRERSGIRCYHDHDPNQMAKLARELMKFQIKFNYIPADKRDKKISIQWMRDLVFKQRLQFAVGAKEVYREFCGYKFAKNTSRDITEHQNSHGPDMVRYALWTRARNNDETLIYKKA